MPAYAINDIRNIALVGHASSGKTLLAERMLYTAGVIGSMGDIARGTTLTDHDPQEKEHQRSLYSAIASLNHLGKHINLIDVPGYPDFISHAFSALSAVEIAVVVIDARTGPQVVTGRMMEAARKRGVRRLIVVNKIDADDVDLSALLDDIRDTFGDECLPVNLPAKGAQEVADCFFDPSTAVTDFSSVDEAHTRLVDQVVEMDEELMEAYLEQGENLQADALHDAFGLALGEGHLIPVCFTSAESGTGVAEFLDVVARLMPSPVEAGAPEFIEAGPDSSPGAVTAPDPARSAVAHVFSVTIDNFVGRLGIFRIHQGTITKDSQLYIGEARKPFKVAHLFKVQGKDQEEIDAGIAGDICAVAKVDDIALDSLLHESHDEDEIRIRPIGYPTPMYGLAVTAKTRGDEQKISDALGKLAAEDPCFKVEHNSVTNETVIRGLGDLHVRVLLERMKERYNVEVDTRAPKIEYKETIRVAAEGHGRHQKQDRV